MAFFHDVAVTENFYILYHNPMVPDLAKVATKVIPGGLPLGEAVKHEPSLPGRIYLVPRWGPKVDMSLDDVYSFECPSRITLHHVNAYECEHQGQRHVVLDSITYGSLDFAGIGSTTGGRALKQFKVLHAGDNLLVKF